MVFTFYVSLSLSPSTSTANADENSDDPPPVVLVAPLARAPSPDDDFARSLSPSLARPRFVPPRASSRARAMSDDRGARAETRGDANAVHGEDGDVVTRLGPQPEEDRDETFTSKERSVHGIPLMTETSKTPPRLKCKSWTDED